MAIVPKKSMLTYTLLSFIAIVVVCTFQAEAAAITCSTAADKLTPCLDYLSSGGVPPKPCCAGIKSLKAAAKTKADRQLLCNCLKDTAAALDLSKATLALAEGLPAKCGVSIPFKVTPKVDCTKVQ